MIKQHLAYIPKYSEYAQIFGASKNAKRPQGQKRPADAVGCAVHAAKIATGEIEDAAGKPRQPNKANGGRVGGARRAKSMTSERRSEIAAQARWQK